MGEKNVINPAVESSVLWSVEKSENVEKLREAGVDFSTEKREVVNICDSCC